MDQERLQAILTGIRRFCAANADDQVIAKYRRYFKEGYDAYGVADSVLHAQRDAWFNIYGDELGLAGFLDLGDLLFASGKFEEGSLAITFVLNYRKQFDLVTFHRAGKWLEFGVRNWAHADSLSSEVFGHCLGKGVASLTDIAPWRESPFKFKRRVVPVSLLVMLKRTEDYAPLLNLLRPLMTDQERVVQQGLGWFLREAWKRQPEQAEAFLLEWKDVAPRLIFQYATEKMSPEGKARFRRGRA